MSVSVSLLKLTARSIRARATYPQISQITQIGKKKRSDLGREPARNLQEISKSSGICIICEICEYVPGVCYCLLNLDLLESGHCEEYRSSVVPLDNYQPEREAS